MPFAALVISHIPDLVYKSNVWILCDIFSPHYFEFTPLIAKEYTVYSCTRGVTLSNFSGATMLSEHRPTDYESINIGSGACGGHLRMTRVFEEGDGTRGGVEGSGRDGGVI